jgi:rhamnose transport system permease protein
MSTNALAPRGRARSPLSRFATWDYAVIAVTLLFLLIASATVESFGTSRNAAFLILDMAPILVLALPMTLIIISGEIDLSVASIVGLTSAAMGVMWNNGLPLETIIPLTVLLGTLLGAVNGVFVTFLGLPSLAVTIGTLALYRGLAFVLLGDTAVADWPRAFTSWVIGNYEGTSIPRVVTPIVVLVVVFWIVLHATPVGRGIFAAGANPHRGNVLGRSGRPTQVLVVRRVRCSRRTRRRVLDIAVFQRSWR